MARTRAKDYDDKRDAMLHGAARIFARDGYDRASMNQLATELGVSKALLYHYYTSKEALLFDIIETHLQELVEAVEEADRPGAPPQERLEGLVTALLEAYRDADNEHRVQLSGLQLLPDTQQEELKALERRLVAIFAEAIRQMNPDAFDSRPLLKPATMSLFGMLNWFYMWFREDRGISRQDYAKLATHLLVSGVKELP
ncbi:TetR/AcrR family transcriptional regulator [Nitratireductor rhodophyticola]|uniref:TetR/AcrR family transcriptional regulator n=1 Tax=Nitratireductor rhodophyticola TaxID=2854036 RepID=A0ABS7R4I9_9HYPH|nr:TetR/AcrR family transcriptional regulator [Nitratireductor rhodophyticola]MBY8915838.1 TetR/AcrR family transcriptional regulator [Nitratireductor rhodophyticola]MBY8919093.1 TetR/AcrR family transcriptional regulator [Nitratireductor rhodophyticola]MEC9244440.1 TetR/AcrR family transcriptional regulator [Pseudomonadota bacterium]WPZ12985.1 TetR/AcrR family transcriptional regulator [Nitratireductor rhodophyticola]